MKQINRFLLFIVSFNVILSSSANTDRMTNAELIATYFNNGQFDKIIDIADDILEFSSNDLKEDEKTALLFGTFHSLKVGDTIRVAKYKQKLLSDKEFNSHINSVVGFFSKDLLNKSSFQKLTIDDKRKQSLAFIQQYEALQSLSPFLTDNILPDVEMIQYFHDCIFGYRSIFDTNDDMDQLILSKILCLESTFLLKQFQYEIFLYNIFQEIKDLDYTKNVAIAVNLNYQLSLLENSIVELGFTDKGEILYNERCDFLLYLLELRNYINSCGYHRTNYTHLDLMKSLEQDEAILLMYNYELKNINFIGSIYIDKNGVQSKDMSLHFLGLSNSDNTAFENHPSDLIKSVLDHHHNINNLYICPIDLWQNTDIAYTNNRIHLKRSFSDLISSKRNDCFTKGIVSFYGDFDFGEGKLKPLLFSKKECEELYNMFGSSFSSLTGRNVSRINFLNIIDDVSILHISTHGVSDIAENYNSNRFKKAELALYSASVFKQGIALSKYNENPAENYVSSIDISKRKFHNCGLVFLNLCESGLTQSSFWSNQGLTLSFSLAGASNVISYLTPIDDEISCDFALTFYKNLLQSDNKNYHDTFFKTKIEIIEKYKNQLLYDDLGRPRLDVVLWE